MRNLCTRNRLAVACVTFFCVVMLASVSFAASVNADLLQAARDGNVDGVKAALDQGADINVKSPRSGSMGEFGEETPLIMASRWQHVDVVRELLERDANLNVVSTGGFTALMQAAKKGNLEIVLLLVDKGADVNVRGQYGFRALEIAKLNKSPNQAIIVHILQEAEKQGK